nr:hypothetical protein BaRGS_012614 [Batillaria attramentaria]
MIGLQYQMRENQKELQDFLSDLGSWEDEMKHKEAELKKKPDNKPQELPPVRNSLDKKKLKKKKKKKPEDQGKPKRIRGFDFRAWDKFDVDKALEEVDKEEGEKSSSEYETDEEWEAERKKHLANEKKNEGNAHFSAGAYEIAVECYTHGMELDPTNALLPANRAMALLKLERYAAAEADCVTAITLDPLYVKAYLRRAAARVGLQRLPQALEDYRRVLQLEPTNKQAKTELERLEKELNRDQDGMQAASSLEKSQTSEVKPIYKPPEQRSKKPLRRIEIEEIGVKENTQRKEAIAKVEAAQSAVKKELEAKDRQMFERFTADSVSVRQSSAANGGDRNDGQMTPGDIPALRNSQMQEVPASQQNGIAQHTNASGDSSSVNSKISSTDSGKQNSQKQTKPSVAKPLSPRSAGGGLNSVDSILNREPPQTSYQFQADFKVLKSEDEAFYAYLKRIDPSQYSKLFGQSLEAVVLLKIVDAIQRHFIPAKEDFFQHLKNLSEVKRFSMTVMFLSAKEKQGIRDIFQHLRTQSGHPQEQVEALAKKYEV